MSIPVLASGATAAKAQPAGAPGGSTATPGPAPAGMFAAVLQSSLGRHDTSTSGKSGDRDDILSPGDGTEQIVVPALFTAVVPASSVSSLTDAAGLGVAGVVAPAGADAAGGASAGAAAASAGTVAAMSTPGSPTAPSDVSGPAAAAIPVAALSAADSLATETASVQASTTGAMVAGLVQTTGDGSMTRAGARPSGPPGSPASRAMTGASEGTAIAAAASATASAAAASATAPTASPAASANAATVTPVSAGPATATPATATPATATLVTAAPVAAAAAPESTPPPAGPAGRVAADAAPGAAPADRFATALSAHAPLATEAIAAASPETTQPALVPGAVPVHQAAPAVPAAPAAPTASVGAASSSAQPVPFTAQVATPLFTLVGAKPGEHVLTINVTPDNLGPVVVRAHVSADSVRVELFAPNDAGRDALRAILPDLRRDLAGSGLNANLDLSSQNHASDSESAGREASRERRALEVEAAAEQPAGTTRSRGFGSSSTIDVLA